MFKYLGVLVVAGCRIGTPDPPHKVATAIRSMSLADRHEMFVSAGELTTPPGIVLGASEVPGPTDNDGVAIELDIPLASKVATGRAPAGVISVTGSGACWGDPSRGARGSARTCTAPTRSEGHTDCRLPAMVLPNLPPMRDIAAGDDVTCAISLDDHVVCWGEAGAKLGGSAVPPFGAPRAVAVPGGDLLAARLVIQHGVVCAIDHDAIAWCWGDGLGAEPVRQPYDGVVDLAIGANHTCLISRAGLACWGENLNAQCGDVGAARACQSEGCFVGRTAIPLDAVRVVVGERHSCALVQGGAVACWGSNELGQVGHDDAFLTGDVGVVLDGATDLAAGFSRSCALRTDHSVWCWGDNPE
ncbi:MAG TPA: hypothetical protein VGD80_27040 [Kofleriaceae bacterium]